MRTDDFWAVLDPASADERGASDGRRDANGPDASGRPGGPNGRGASDAPRDAEAVAARALARLADRDPAEILAWGAHLDKVMVASGTEDLWAAAYLVNGGCSEEGFDAFRGWLIAQGRAVVARTVREPDALAALPAVRAAAQTGAAVEAAEILSIADRAYEQATGDEAPGRPAVVTRPQPDDLWDFDDEQEMSRRLPRLSALFLEPPD